MMLVVPSAKNGQAYAFFFFFFFFQALKQARRVFCFLVILSVKIGTLALETAFMCLLSSSPCAEVVAFGLPVIVLLLD